MGIGEILGISGGGLFVLLTIFQVAPININPWSAIARWIGRAINGEVLDELKKVQAAQAQNEDKLEKHIDKDERDKTDECRGRILRFNNELIREIPHTKEEFFEVLKDIDAYERYCREHENYENGRAVHAITNINRVYDDRLKNHDFIGP